MALHRDIHWIGRQWAVTGCGMQAIDQRHGGKFDIDTAQLWDGGLQASLSEQKWFNADDFAKGLAIARKRFPGSPRPPGLEPAQPPLPTPPPAAPPQQASGVITPPAQAAPVPPPLPAPTVLQASGVIAAQSIEPPKPVPPTLQMRIPGRARFVRPWRFPPRSS